MQHPKQHLHSTIRPLRNQWVLVVGFASVHVCQPSRAACPTPCDMHVIHFVHIVGGGQVWAECLHSLDNGNANHKQQLIMLRKNRI